MPIQVTCTCGKQYKLKDEFAGRRAKCPACGGVITVPIPKVSEPAKTPTIPEPIPVDAPARKSRLPLVLAVCGGVAVLAIIAVLVFAAMKKPDKSVPGSAQNDQVAGVRLAPSGSPVQASVPPPVAMANHTSPTGQHPPSKANIAPEVVAERILQSLTWGDVAECQVGCDRSKMSDEQLFTQPYDPIDPRDHTPVNQGPRLQVLAHSWATSATLILDRAPWAAASFGTPERREKGVIAYTKNHNEVKAEVEWLSWSWVSLGVDADGRCRALRIDGARWRERHATADPRSQTANGVVSKTRLSPIDLLQRIEKDNALKLLRVWQSLEGADEWSVPALGDMQIQGTRSRIIGLLGNPDDTSTQKVPGLYGAVGGKSVEMSASFLWYGQVGIGFINGKDDATVVAIGYRPDKTAVGKKTSQAVSAPTPITTSDVQPNNPIPNIPADWAALINRAPDDVLMVYAEAVPIVTAEKDYATFTFVLGPGNELRLRAPPPPGVMERITERLRNRKPGPLVRYNAWTSRGDRITAVRAGAIYEEAFAKAALKATGTSPAGTKPIPFAVSAVNSRPATRPVPNTPTPVTDAKPAAPAASDLALAAMQRRITGTWVTTTGDEMELVVEFDGKGRIPTQGQLANGGKSLFTDQEARNGDELYTIDMTQEPPVLRAFYSPKYEGKTMFEWKILAVTDDHIDVSIETQNRGTLKFRLVRFKGRVKE